MSSAITTGACIKLVLQKWLGFNTFRLKTAFAFTCFSFPKFFITENETFFHGRRKKEKKFVSISSNSYELWMSYEWLMTWNGLEWWIYPKFYLKMLHYLYKIKSKTNGMHYLFMNELCDILSMFKVKNHMTQWELSFGWDSKQTIRTTQQVALGRDPISGRGSTVWQPGWESGRTVIGTTQYQSRIHSERC